jgi:protein-arginine kinase activator protein McsA
MYIEKLKSDLKNAIDEQNFELAAKLRDEIAELSAKGGNE